MPSNDLDQLKKKFAASVSKIASLNQLESIRKEYLGKKGLMDGLLKNIKNLSIAEKKDFGRKVNELKQEILAELDSKKAAFEDEQLKGDLESKKEDYTVPPTPFWIGSSHPITQVLNEVTGIFQSMGFGISEGPEIETDENNFGALNIPANHPARDMHDTFYVGQGTLSRDKEDKSMAPSQLLLRTHTSPVQIRVMRQNPPPIRIIAPGKVYRHEAIDATHSSVFHQVEGLVVDSNTTFADLKGTLEIFCKKLFGQTVKTRFRPSYFPFVEPGAEMDISCTICNGATNGSSQKPCSVCKSSGWLEMLGAGMVHPNVFKAVGYDPTKVSGYAFGMGIERIAMVRHGITDMRLFFQNHTDFLNQF